MTDAKILFFDIESAPSLGWAWSRWETNILDYKTDWYVLSYAWKWLGEKSVHVKGLDDFTGFVKDKENDKELIKGLWKLFDEADIIIGHNVDSFDVRKTNSRFISHGLNPPSPYKTVDTLKIARKVFKFDSNKLDDLGRYLGLGRKLAHTGFHLWRKCMEGDEKSWRLMKRYNKRDVVLLEDVYQLMKPWASNHPNVNQGKQGCPKCGSENTQRRGFSYTLLRKKQRYQCSACHGWFEKAAEKV